MDFDKLAIDPDAIENGVEVHFAKDTYVTVRSKRCQAAKDVAASHGLNTSRRKVLRSDINEDLERALLPILVKSWRGIEVGGKAMPSDTAEQRLAVLLNPKFSFFKEWCIEQAIDDDVFGADIEAAAGN